MWNRFKTFDPWLFVAPLLLMVISVVAIYTLTVNSADSSLFIHQAEFSVLGLILLLLAAFVDYRSLKAWMAWIYGAGFMGLLLVLAVGSSQFGAKRWIDIGFFQLQPGELEKLVVIIGIAAVLSRSLATISYRRFFLAVGMLLVPFVLVLAQPDLGTGIVIAAAGISVILHSRLTRGQRVIVLGGILAVILVFSLSFHEVRPFSKLMKEYQKDRLASFVEPSRDPGGSGYNVLQSVIAVGSGELTGKGLGFGSQSQLNFLPVAHADFIFAGIAEAWGFVGAVGIIALYGIILTRTMQAARIAKDEFGMLLCVGIAVKIGVEMLVNIGMNIRLMPVTGIPLPFLSYGGTTMITNALCLGLVQSIMLRYKRLTF